MSTRQHRRVALVLGAGGARGYAHIGAVEVIRERGYEVAAVSGTSMGAVVGGVTAAGRLEDFTEWVRTLTKGEVWGLLDLAFSAAGVIRADRVIGKVSELLDGVCIEDLPIPYTAVATDLTAQREVWFQRGPVDTALRASIAVPTVITPVMLGGHLIVDGGLLNPLPVDPVAGLPTDLTVAIDLFGPPRVRHRSMPREATSEHADSRSRWLRFDMDGVLDSDLVRSLTDRFARRGVERDPAEAGAGTVGAGTVGAAALEAAPEGGSPQPGRAPAGPPPPTFDPLPKDLRMLDIVNLSLDTMASLITRYRVATIPPDITVHVPSDACAMVDYHRAAEMIDLGRELTSAALDRFEEGLAEQS